jgi:hypothetical protein
MTFKILKSKVAQHPNFADHVAQHATELNLWADREKIVAEESKTPLPARPAWGDFGHHVDPATEYSKAVAEWEKAKLARHAPIQRPMPHPDIEASVRRDGDKFVPDFEIVNDDPTPEQILQAKKSALIRAVSVMEEAEIAKIAPPPGKRRHFNFRLNDIASEDQKRLQALSRQIDDTNVPLDSFMQKVAQLTLKSAKFDADQNALKEKPDAEIVLDPFTSQDQVDLDDAKNKIKATKAKLAELSAHFGNPDDFHDARRPPEDQKFFLEQKNRREQADSVMRWAAQLHSDIEDLTLENIDAFEIPSFENRAPSRC